LESWLLDLLQGKYGAVPGNIVITVGGRYELNRDHWAPYEGILSRIPLDPFSDDEARDYLNRRSIVDARTVETILRLSGNLPLLVATLATHSPNDPNAIGDPTGTAVERFLKWVDDFKQRQIALDASLPRWLNRDILAVLVGENDADTLFSWLKSMPFVKERHSDWIYHDVVRTQMLHYKMRESPQGWSILHSKLATCFEALRDRIRSSEEEGMRDANWRIFALEALYHRLCETPSEGISKALNDFLATLKFKRSLAFRWAKTIQQAGRDSEDSEVEGWGTRLLAGLEAYENDQFEVSIAVFSALLEHQAIQEVRRPAALVIRGFSQLNLGRSDEALSDFNRAVDLDPSFNRGYVGRAVVFFTKRRYQDALIEIDQASALSPKEDYLQLLGIMIYFLEGQIDEVTLGVQEYLEVHPNDPIAIMLQLLALVSRGDEKALVTKMQTLAKQGKTSALQSAATEGDDATTFPQLNKYYDLFQQFMNASLSSDFEPADAERYLSELEWGQSLPPDFGIAFLSSPGMLQYLSRSSLSTMDVMLRKFFLDNQEYDAALAWLSRNMELAPNDYRFYLLRWPVYAALRRYIEALADITRASELDGHTESDTDAVSYYLSNKGLLLSYLERYGEAIELYEQVLRIEPGSYSAQYNIAVATVRANSGLGAGLQVELARKSLEAILDLPERSLGLYGLGGLEALQGNTDLALDYLEKAFSLDEGLDDMAKHDMAWLDLRRDPRFISLMARKGLRTPNL
jgi:tetratricopeptide (TPR) repeat protein